MDETAPTDRLQQVEDDVQRLTRQLAIAPPFSATLNWGGIEVEQVAPRAEEKK